MDGDDGDDRLFRDIAEEVTYGLARYRTLAVISPYSALGLSPDGPREVHADYVVRGRVRRAGDRYRISVYLTETSGMRQIWGETFTLDETEVLTLENTLPRRIIQRVAATAEESAMDAPLSGRPADIQAFRHFVTARRYLRDVGPGVNEAACDHLREALKIDPDFAIALGYLALAEVIAAGYGSAPKEVLDRALVNASRAVALAPEEARCHRMLGLVHQFRRETGAAEFHARHALELNPYDTDTMAALSYMLSNQGRGLEALELCRRAIELNPFHPMWYFLDLAVAAFTAGDYGLSIESLQARAARPDARDPARRGVRIGRPHGRGRPPHRRCARARPGLGSSEGWGRSGGIRQPRRHRPLRRGRSPRPCGAAGNRHPLTHRRTCPPFRLTPPPLGCHAGSGRRRQEPPP